MTTCIYCGGSTGGPAAHLICAAADLGVRLPPLKPPEPEVTPYERIPREGDHPMTSYLYEPTGDEAPADPDDDMPLDAYREDPDEVAPCLVCGAPIPAGDRCDCLDPAMLVTVTLEVRARQARFLPPPESLVTGIFEGLADEWFSPYDGDDFYIVNGTVQATATEYLNCPPKEAPDAPNP